MEAMSAGLNNPLRRKGVRLPSPPVRIASLVPSTTDILAAIGVADAIVARSHECQHGDATVVTSSTIDPELPSSSIDEAVAAGLANDHTIYGLDTAALEGATPDIVFTQDLCEVCAVDHRAIEACTLPAGAQVVSSDPKTLDDVL